MLNRNGESGHSYFIPYFREFFQMNTTEYNSCYEFVIYGIYYVEVCSLYAHFWEKIFIISQH